MNFEIIEKVKKADDLFNSKKFEFVVIQNQKDRFLAMGSSQHLN